MRQRAAITMKPTQFIVTTQKLSTVACWPSQAQYNQVFYCHLLYVNYASYLSRL